ncbi:RluA family pseudouridine synthase [Dysgonomonas sp. 521]|uniref:RluA family pseudouridine synthase n=1 Tax=Dysgonomonas sp. 521 TaxID=2302932 RepID=UPI0013D39477|nr:RluA family pseudouridine synthase [Dysgonomonas sp. 521]NDV93679.1 RluA family pseudouridine synthase [Dysgonomonas sp. 521]
MTDNSFDEIDDFSEDDFAEEQNSELFEHYRFVADKGQGQIRVDKYLAMHIVGVSRNRIQQAAEANCILVNDTPVKSNYKIKPLDVISVVMNRPPRELEIVPENIPLDVVYEDEDLMVINKPPGLVVHPGFGNYQGTMVNAIAYRLKDSPEYDPKDPRLGIVHRIDKDTSGLILVAKNANAKTHLSAQFFNKTTKRQYVALVWGTINEDKGRIEGNIGRSLKDRMLMTVFPNGDYGKPAVTHFEILERLGYVTFIKCRLETGRTHQIRVHMKYIGHTLFNDERYGGNEILKGTNFAKYKQFVQNCFSICPRQALHAQTLGFIHPRTGEEMMFEAPLPDDINLLLEKWRGYIAHREL